LVEDTAHMLNVIAGHDPRPDFEHGSRCRLHERPARRREGLVIGVPRDYINQCAPRTESVVLKLVGKAIDEFESWGARVEEVKVPTLNLATIANAVIYYNEFWAAHKSDAAGVLRTAAGAGDGRVSLNSADYIQAQRAQPCVPSSPKYSQEADCLALPCQAGPAPLVKDVGPIDTLFKHVAPEFNGPFNLAGLPTLVVPVRLLRRTIYPSRPDRGQAV
jgi:Asp-tRNA(Asn)/Glu-tRNA(Gln) amidotransferase A subunit family amidase